MSLLDLPLVYQIGIVGSVWILLAGLAKEPGIGWVLAMFLSFLPATILAMFIVDHPELFPPLT